MHTDDKTETIIDQKVTSRVLRFFLGMTVLLSLTVLILVLFAIQAPYAQKELKLDVKKGMSVFQITELAKEVHVVRSSLLLYAILHYAYNPRNIYAGTYSFKDGDTVFAVAKKIAQNDIDSQLIQLTIPEGTTRKEVARLAVSKNPNFDVQKFLEETVNQEGYLFPETYFVSPEFTEMELVSFFTKTYEEKIAPLRPLIAHSKFSEYQVLTLASLLERETNSGESMKVVAGILENRIAIGMALQVDASLEYILDKPLQKLTPSDLKIDSPYNTYLHNGLPPTPIGNPGLLAIEAILNPTKSSYFYYITDAQGTFHYAKTFEEHKQNVSTYLK